jgi:hypothetical protein
VSDDLATGVPGLTAAKKTTQEHGASPEGYKAIPVKLVAGHKNRHRPKPRPTTTIEGEPLR